MIAVVDIGNSRLKWAFADAGRLISEAAAVPLDAIEHAVDALAKVSRGRIDAVWVSNVAGPKIAAQFEETLRSRFDAEARFVATLREGHGIRGAYVDPAGFGVDRWLALIAAHHRTDGAVCVVDAGTAVTFDAVDATGAHLGGLIIASPELMAGALAGGTDGIGQAPASPKRPRGTALLADTTAAAVTRGGWLAVSAAVDRAVAVVRAELGAEPSVLLTGGGALALENWLETKVDFEADLVLEGLALTAAQTQ